MRKNKFFLLLTPALFPLLVLLALAWDGLKAAPELGREALRFPGVFRKAWKNAKWV